MNFQFYFLIKHNFISCKLETPLQLLLTTYVNLLKHKKNIIPLNVDKARDVYRAHENSYFLDHYIRSNQATCITQRPSVKLGEWVQKGDFLCDTTASSAGELALGKNILVAYMPWHGYNFEDAILVNETLIIYDIYTSLHLEKFEIEIENTNWGPEIIKLSDWMFSDKRDSLYGKELFTQETTKQTYVKEKQITIGVLKQAFLRRKGKLLINRRFISKIHKYEFLTNQRFVVPQFRYQQTLFQQINKNPKKQLISRSIIENSNQLSIYNKPKIRFTNNVISSKLFKPLIIFSQVTLLNILSQCHIDKSQYQPTSELLSSKLVAKEQIHELLFKQPKKTGVKIKLKHGTSHTTDFYNKDLLSNTKMRAGGENHRPGESKIYLGSKASVKFINMNFQEKKTNGYKKISLYNNKTSSQNNVNKKSFFLFLNKSILFLNKPRPKYKSTRPVNVSLNKSAFIYRRSFRTLFPYNFKNMRLSCEKLFVNNNNWLINYIKSLDVVIGGEIYRPGNKLQINLEYLNFKYGFVQKNNYDHLDNDGIIKLGTWVKPGDIIVSKLRPIGPHNPTPLEKLVAAILKKKFDDYKNAAFYTPKDVYGRIVGIEILEPKNLPSDVEYSGIGRVEFYLVDKRRIFVGDKMAGRHGNKGIISNILPKQDMPYLPDGTPVDMVLNPLGVPSRMNVGQVFETLLGLAGKYLHQHFKVTPFDEVYGPEASRSLVYSKLYEARLKTDQNWIFDPKSPGKTRIFDGQTGANFDQAVTAGYAYMLKLIHLVDHKIHARSTGPYALVTQQPVRGRSRAGGQRLGEMEFWALEAFGASYNLQEMMTIKSDDILGRTQVFDSILNSKPIQNSHPESFRVFINELRSLGVNFQSQILHQYNPNIKTKI
uniref:DNA-directed RNA polymerase subunit beta C-terminal section n=1 Tax=Pleurastrum terricola TaxID=34116 RepID=RPOB2_PLETE|nr:RNA polymerase beta chain [Pleurastrum terricola]A6YGE0.1 RecName: Full=DNA-directed RNA polymerase subunit beta C-terminal section; AltName: Full=PEP; AltName: Full=Plastid-encoded RNA polymerase subunit beta C-terminal section; Short=RNA polymerase subunit beta C-terminal section [Pleurastrum terricola]ABO69352.1 RNA polymerase beta chain [Pleurastrum terricola]